MFGYVRPLTAELKVGEYEKYRAVYCGVCREIGRTSGQLSRFALSYDTVLLCSVRMILENITPEFDSLRCPAHPMTKRAVLLPNSATRFTAAVFDALVSSNIADDLADERGLRKIKPALLSPLAAHLRKCAGRELPDGTDEKLRSLLEELSRLESEKCPSADLTSDAFGDVLAFLFSLGLDGEKADIASSFGFAVGRFIYICDALDDLPDDIRRDRYNPLRYGWGEYALDGGKVSPLVADSIKTALPVSLEPLSDAVEKLNPTHPLTPIVKNIVYLGLPCSADRIISGKARDKKEKRRSTEADNT